MAVLTGLNALAQDSTFISKIEDLEPVLEGYQAWIYLKHDSDCLKVCELVATQHVFHEALRMVPNLTLSAVSVDIVCAAMKLGKVAKSECI